MKSQSDLKPDRALAPKEHSQLAELHVAGLFADAGWRVYFHHVDDGFDFIAIKPSEDGLLIRPVQVKGKYPEGAKTDKRVYGYVGRLTQVHPDMVLAIPYFEVGSLPVLRHVAFMPFCMVRRHSRGWRCFPAKFFGGHATPRGDHSKYFDNEGLRRLEHRSWSAEELIDDLIEEED